MVFSICTRLWQPSPLTPEHFCNPGKKLLWFGSSHSPFLSPPSPRDLPISHISCKRNHTKVVFCVGFLLLRILFSRFIRIVAFPSLSLNPLVGEMGCDSTGDGVDWVGPKVRWASKFRKVVCCSRVVPWRTAVFCARTGKGLVTQPRSTHLQDPTPHPAEPLGSQSF